jgi:hypothetical protein
VENVSRVRGEIFEYFQGHDSCQKYFFAAGRQHEYVSYYNSMYLLQDSTESLSSHRQKGFSKDPLLAYLEFWGVMQAAIIQQDSIRELFLVITGDELDARKQRLTAWPKVRELRNICAGHPAKSGERINRPLARSFMGRGFGDYAKMAYEKWEDGAGTSHPRVNLGALLDEYADEAEEQLSIVLAAMKRRWV